MNAEPTRLVLVINDLRRAGAETQLVRLAIGLDRARFAVSVIVLKQCNEFEMELAAAGIQVTKLGRRYPWDFAIVWRLARELRRARPSIVHSYLSFANLLSVLVAGAAGVPCVVLSQRSSYASSLSPFWLRVARWAHRRASHVIANSNAARQEEIAAGFPPERISCVPNGIDVPNESPPESRASLDLPEGPLAVCVGQLVMEKDHATLLAAWALVRKSAPTATLALLGAGALQSDLEAQAQAAGIAASVLFLGARHPSLPWIRAADLVVQSSVSEGMPNAVLEAMAAGRPIVATRAGGIPELVEDGVSGLLVPARDPEALARAILDLLGDATRRGALGARARERASREFSVARMVARTEAVYALLGAGADGNAATHS